MFRRHKRPHRGRRLGLALLLLIIAFGGFMYTKPLPALKPVNDLVTVKASSVTLNWPTAPEAAVGAAGYGVLTINGAQTERPIASTAKLITALTVLQRYPLAPSEAGPTLTLSAADIALYSQYQAEDGSVVKVAAGEQISEYQMLEAMLLPSANNIADSLAIWAFGSLPAYTTAANQFVASLGLKNTIVGSDASGFLPGTESTAHDLVLLGENALNSPVLARIVSLKQASLPVAGTVNNVNWLLGTDGIVGIKTGNTDQAGGVFIFGADDQVDASHNVTIIGAIAGSDNLQDALNSAVPLLDSAKQNFVVSNLVTAEEIIGHYNVPWGNAVPAVSAKPVAAVTWLGAPSKPKPSLNIIRGPQKAGTNVGTISIKASGVTGNVVLKQAILSPPWWWRLIRHKL
jgi:D-alanyl-D-alanine carboxypeptidase (penicillin-binding protein 5/6)